MDFYLGSGVGVPEALGPSSQSLSPFTSLSELLPLPESLLCILW